MKDFAQIWLISKHIIMATSYTKTRSIYQIIISKLAGSHKSTRVTRVPLVNDRYRNRQIRYADIHADNRILSDLLQFPHICMSANLHCICRYDLYLQIMQFNLQIINFFPASVFPTVSLEYCDGTWF